MLPRRNSGHGAALKLIRLTCLVGCRLTITTFPPLRFVRSGRSPLGLICMDVPRVSARSAFLQSQQMEIKNFFFKKGRNRKCAFFDIPHICQLFLKGNSYKWVCMKVRVKNGSTWASLASRGFKSILV